MFEAREALGPVIGQCGEQADDGIERVVHREQHGLHAAELVAWEREV